VVVVEFRRFLNRTTILLQLQLLQISTMTSI
jgi:hypothetical protein